MNEFVRDFCRPLLLGGGVTVGFPLDDAAYRAAVDAEPDAPLNQALWARARTVWAGCPPPPRWVIGVFVAVHDLLVGLHPGSGWWAPERTYLAKLARRISARNVELPQDPCALVYRWVVTEAALVLSRVDTFVQFYFVGSVAAYGKEPEYRDLPWRVEGTRDTRTTTALAALEGPLADLVVEVSPMTAARMAIDGGHVLPVAAMEPLFHESALARWLARSLADSATGREALVRTLGATSWDDPARLRRWLGLTVYVAQDAGPGDDHPSWRSTVAALTPFSPDLGGPPAPDPSGPASDPPQRWHHLLIRDAQLRSP